MEETDHSHERLNRLFRLLGCSFLKSLDRVAHEHSAVILTEAAKIAADTLKREGVVLERLTPVETLNAVLSYFVDSGFLNSACAEPLAEKHGSGLEVVRIRAVPSTELSGVCALGKDNSRDSDGSFCCIILKYAIAAMSCDLVFLSSSQGQNAEIIIDTAIGQGAARGPLADGEQDSRTGKLSWGFRRAIAMSLDAIVSIDEGGKIILWNPAAERVFGYSEEEMLGKSIDVLVPAEYFKQHQNGIRRFVSTGQGRLIGKVSEVEGLRKDGTKFPVELSLSAEREESRWIFTGIIRDISGRKKLEDELRQRLIEMERINKIMVGREIRMQELRDEIKALRSEKNGKKAGTF